MGNKTVFLQNCNLDIFSTSVNLKLTRGQPSLVHQYNCSSSWFCTHILGKIVLSTFCKFWITFMASGKRFGARWPSSMNELSYLHCFHYFFDTFHNFPFKNDIDFDFEHFYLYCKSINSKLKRFNNSILRMLISTKGAL